MRFDVAFRRCLPLCLAGLVGMAGSHVFAQNTENAAPAKYVGVEVCQGCHEDLYESFSKSAHVETLKNKSAATSGCEGCHGPGAEHVESGGDPGKIWRYADAKLDTVLERCKRCHEANLGEAHQGAPELSHLSLRASLPGEEVSAGQVRSPALPQLPPPLARLDFLRCGEDGPPWWDPGLEFPWSQPCPCDSDHSPT